ncbi:MAG: FMN-binding negative transcriptional regulator, partial [Paracoccaceae bacterium]
MYTPASFLETNPQVIEDIVTSFPLATIVAVVDGEYVVNPIPVLWRDGQLLGHIAKANDMHRLIPDDGKVVAIFRGVDSYVSPNWYPSKA